jgi:predicted PurR-regulated permease PerM
MTTQPVGNERPRSRLARLFEAADRRHVPLRTILVTAGVVVATYLAGKLIYRLQDIVVLVAGFVAMLLNPAVAQVQRRIPRRGLAVTIVTLLAALAFVGLAAAFGVPLVNGTTHLADRLPSYVASALPKRHERHSLAIQSGTARPGVCWRLPAAS